MKKFIIGVTMAALIIGGGYFFFNQSTEIKEVAENTAEPGIEQNEKSPEHPGQKEDKEKTVESTNEVTAEFEKVKKELEQEGVNVELALKQIEENNHKVFVPKLSINGGSERDENGNIMPSEGSEINQSEDIDKVTIALQKNEFDVEKVTQKFTDKKTINSNDKKTTLNTDSKSNKEDSEHKENTLKKVEIKAEESKDTDSKDDSSNVDKCEENTSTSNNTSSEEKKEEDRIKEIIAENRVERAIKNNEYVPEQEDRVPDSENPFLNGEFQPGERAVIDVSDEGWGTGDKF